ncbi:MAG TPA: hypothetical protein VE944_23870 [Nostoc sp.]|uniref:hypothetical protein n=1 Tax=Nostoc sp. TaxID=1180 RepID=UPI002D467005|nr:hypothetical protein [Nostoc sp.]HYX17334.1 hypothetical protein [Nostoc sp.]
MWIKYRFQLVNILCTKAPLAQKNYSQVNYVDNPDPRLLKEVGDLIAECSKLIAILTGAISVILAIAYFILIQLLNYHDMKPTSII